MLHVVFAKVEHDLKEETKVDGFQEPGSFSQRVTYLAPKEVRANKSNLICQEFKIALEKILLPGDWKVGGGVFELQTVSRLLLPQLSTS